MNNSEKISQWIKDNDLESITKLINPLSEFTKNKYIYEIAIDSILTNRASIFEYTLNQKIIINGNSLISTFLEEAAAKGYIDVINILIKHNKLVELSEQSLSNIIFSSIEHNRTDIAINLINASKERINQSDSFKAKIFMQSIAKDDVKVFKNLETFLPKDFVGLKLIILNLVMCKSYNIAKHLIDTRNKKHLFKGTEMAKWEKQYRELIGLNKILDNELVKHNGTTNSRTKI